MGTNPSSNEPTRFRSADARIPIREMAQLVDSDGGISPVLLLDISKEGFRFRSDNKLMTGLKAVLRVQRHGDYPIEIKWTRGLEAGGVFLAEGPQVD